MNKPINWRRKIFLQLTPEAGKGLSISVRIILLAIILSIILAIIETEEQFVTKYYDVFNYLNIGLGLFFTIEFSLRFWVCSEDPKYAGFKKLTAVLARLPFRVVS